MKGITFLKNSEIGKNTITIKGKKDEYCLILENEVRHEDREFTIEEYLINLKNKTVELSYESKMTDVDISLFKFIKETFMEVFISKDINTEEFKSFIVYQVDENSPIKIAIIKDDKIYTEDEKYSDFNQFVLSSKLFNFVEFFKFLK